MTEGKIETPMSSAMTPSRIAEIKARVEKATAGPWEAKPHDHTALGCMCIGCTDPVVGWFVDHPDAGYCSDLVAIRAGARELNDFGKPLSSCDAGPLLAYEDAEFAAEARRDVPDLLAEVERLANALAIKTQVAEDAQRVVESYAGQVEQVSRDLAEAQAEAGKLREQRDDMLAIRDNVTEQVGIALVAARAEVEQQTARIADLMDWCAHNLGRSHLHREIRRLLEIPDKAFPWQMPEPEPADVTSAWGLLGIDADEVPDEVERMRPVVEAAKAWRALLAGPPEPYHRAQVRDLIAAIDAHDATAGGNSPVESPAAAEEPCPRCGGLDGTQAAVAPALAETQSEAGQ